MPGREDEVGECKGPEVKEKQTNTFGKLQGIQKDCQLGAWRWGAGGSQKGILGADLEYSPWFIFFRQWGSLQAL